MGKKENKFSWGRKDSKENESDELDENLEIGKEEDFMQFSNGTSAADETKKSGFIASSGESTSRQPAATAFTPKKEESYITKDVVIDGSITAVNSIVIDGSVNGNVTTDSDVTVSGSVEGNITANSVKFAGAKLKGDILCSSNISLVKDTFIEGNVAGKNIEINGSVKGNLTAEESAIVMGSAVIHGDIKAGIISVMEGAVIMGNVQVNKAKKEAGDKAGTEAPADAKNESAKPEPEAKAASAKAGDDTLLKRYI